VADRNDKLDYEVPTQRKATNRLFVIMVIFVSVLVVLAVAGWLFIA
jgi:CHASE3 domain sensor protein